MMNRIHSSSPAGHLDAVKEYLRKTGTNGKTVEQIRLEMDAAAAQWPPVPGVLTEAVEWKGLSGEWVYPEDAPDVNPLSGGLSDLVGGSMEAALHCTPMRAVLYLHGGGFISGTCAFYRNLVSRIALASGVPVLAVDYRLAPEHKYPAANDDCLSAYRRLLAMGYLPENIVLGGDSVGASLALMTMLSQRNDGGPLPAGAFLISPHADLVHLDGESYTSRAEEDPTGSLEGNRRILDAYWSRPVEVAPAILSPLWMDLSGLPELLIQVGGLEVLLSDAERLAAKAQEAGTRVSLEIWEDLWCVFHLLGSVLSEADEAVTSIGAFVRRVLRG